MVSVNISAQILEVKFGRKGVEIRNGKIREMQYIGMFMKRHLFEVLLKKLIPRIFQGNVK